MKSRMKMLISGTLVMALMVAGLVGCAPAPSSTDAPAGDAVTFTVGFDQAYPPYGFVGDDGEYTGFDLDLAAEVAKRNNWDLKLEAIDWDAKDALLNSGSIDVIWNGFTYEGREKDYAWTAPYMLNEQVVVTKKGSDIKTLKDLGGKTVITQVESAAFDVLNGDDYKDLLASLGSLQTISDYNNAFMQLESGTVDAVACDLSIAAFQQSAKPDAFLQLSEPLSSEHYAVGFKIGNEDKAKTVEETLIAMYNDGTVEKIATDYEKYGLSFDNWVLKK